MDLILLVRYFHPLIRPLDTLANLEWFELRSFPVHLIHFHHQFFLLCDEVDADIFLENSYSMPLAAVDGQQGR